MTDDSLDVLTEAGLHVLEMCSEFADNLYRTLQIYPELKHIFGIVFCVNAPITCTGQTDIQLLAGNSVLIDRIKEELNDECK